MTVSMMNVTRYNRKRIKSCVFCNSEILGWTYLFSWSVYSNFLKHTKDAFAAYKQLSLDNRHYHNNNRYNNILIITIPVIMNVTTAIIIIHIYYTHYIIVTIIGIIIIIISSSSTVIIIIFIIITIIMTPIISFI